jgi:hypothetical protein
LEEKRFHFEFIQQHPIDPQKGQGEIVISEHLFDQTHRQIQEKMVFFIRKQPGHPTTIYCGL